MPLLSWGLFAATAAESAPFGGATAWGCRSLDRMPGGLRGGLAVAPCRAFPIKLGGLRAGLVVALSGENRVKLGGLRAGLVVALCGETIVLTEFGGLGGDWKSIQDKPGDVGDSSGTSCSSNPDASSAAPGTTAHGVRSEVGETMGLPISEKIEDGSCRDESKECTNAGRGRRIGGHLPLEAATAPAEPLGSVRTSGPSETRRRWSLLPFSTACCRS